MDTHEPLPPFSLHTTGCHSPYRHIAVRKFRSAGESPARARGHWYTHNTPADYFFRFPCFRTVSEKQNLGNTSLAVYTKIQSPYVRSISPSFWLLTLPLLW